MTSEIFIDAAVEVLKCDMKSNTLVTHTAECNDSFGMNSWYSRPAVKFSRGNPSNSPGNVLHYGREYGDEEICVIMQLRRGEISNKFQISCSLNFKMWRYGNTSLWVFFFFFLMNLWKWLAQTLIYIWKIK